MPFSSGSWDASRLTSLNASQYCSVCLIDMNPSGAEKTKERCKLPVRYTPGGPYVKAALQAAAGVLAGGRGGVQAPAEERRKAARRLVRLMGEAGMTVGASIKRIAGGR